YREFTLAFDRCPMVAKLELRELVPAFVELSIVIAFAARWYSGFGMGQPVSCILTAARSRDRYRRDAVGRKCVPFIGPADIGGLETPANERDIGRTFDG